MDGQEFIDRAKNAVELFVEANHPEVIDYKVFVVWSCKTLQNNKAVLATSAPNNLMFEVTGNGDKEEIYLDVYKKVHNSAIKV